MLTQLQGCSNAGLSLTKERRKQFLEMYNWITKNKDIDNITYQDLQTRLERDTKSLDDSKVRMFVPYMRKLGFINNSSFDNANLINLNSFFTKAGLAFAEHLYLRSDAKELDNQEVLRELEEADQLFCQYGLVCIIESSEWVYLELLKLLTRYSHINRIEFFIMTTLKQNVGKPEYLKELDINIDAYRKGDISEEIPITKHINAYGYVIPFVEECGLIERKQNRVYINPKKVNTVTKILRYFGQKEGQING